jgi:hypothetical protein
MGEAVWALGACQALANGIRARNDLTERQKNMILRRQLVCRVVALAGLCGIRTEPVILDGKELQYEVHMGGELSQARYISDTHMWVVEVEGTVCAFTVDDRTGKVGPA